MVLDTVAAGLYSPSNSVGGSLAAAASPAAAQQIGDYFKNLAAENPNGKLNSEQQTAYILAHGILAAATAAAGGNDALSAGIAAGTAEAAAPKMAKWLYGTDDPNKLSAEQKATVSSITGLGGAAVGAATGSNTATDAVSGSRVAQNAVENNQFNMMEMMFPKMEQWGSQAQGIYFSELQQGASQEQAAKAVQIYLRGKDPHSNAVVKGVGGGLAITVGGVLVGPQALATYGKAALGSATEGLIINTLRKQDYTVSNLAYDASLGVLIDKKTGLMLRWSGTKNQWVGGYLKGHGKVENFLLGEGATTAIGKELGGYDKTLFNSSQWMDNIY